MSHGWYASPATHTGYVKPVRQGKIRLRCSALMSIGVLLIGLTGHADAQTAAKPSRIDSLETIVMNNKPYAWRDTTQLRVAREFLHLIDSLPDRPSRRLAYRPFLASAYAVLARHLYEQGDTTAVRVFLDSAVVRVRGPYGDDYARHIVDNMLGHDPLIGRHAARLVAQNWFNTKEPHPSYPQQGHATLLMFSSQWCGPCHDSYPTIQAIQHQYAARGLQVVLATQTLAHPDKNGKTDPKGEVASDHDYFVRQEGFTIPIAVYVSPGNGAPSPEHPAPNDRAYGVTGLPEYVLIDAHGIIREVGYGWDEWVKGQMLKRVAELMR